MTTAGNICWNKPAHESEIISTKENTGCSQLATTFWWEASCLSLQWRYTGVSVMPSQIVETVQIDNNNNNNKNIKGPHYWSLCENPSVTDWFPSQRVCNAESVTMLPWLHYVDMVISYGLVSNCCGWHDSGRHVWKKEERSTFLKYFLNDSCAYTP